MLPLGIEPAYTNFSPNEPSDVGNDECISMDVRDREWRSENCGEEYLYICEVGQYTAFTQNVFKNDEQTSFII